MIYEWDENKNAGNYLKHSIVFEEAERFEWDTAVVKSDDRKNYGEKRQVAIGYIGLRLYVMVFVLRGENIRVISLRKANRREVKRYAET